MSTRDWGESFGGALFPTMLSILGGFLAFCFLMIIIQALSKIPPAGWYIIGCVSVIIGAVYGCWVVAIRYGKWNPDS